MFLTHSYEQLMKVILESLNSELETPLLGFPGLSEEGLDFKTFSFLPNLFIGPEKV